MRMLCIYHGNCADGFGSAWVVRKQFGENNLDFYPGIYGDPPPVDILGREIIIVDFSYSRKILLEMAQKAQSILIIDHHKTAQKELVDLPQNITTIFDMNHSGCILTWMHFYGEYCPPILMKYIEDRDLWRKELDCSQEVSAALFSYPYDFTVWDEFMQRITLDSLKEEGRHILRKYFRDINALISDSVSTLNIAGYNVPTLNVPYTFASDAGHIMCEGHPFAAAYYVKSGKTFFSLRSDENGIDVSKISEMFGGGGHKHASGFSLASKDIHLLPKGLKNHD